jgi:endonuclease/exonuclease/phosphatase (EEP) superfamily protein YafD
MLLPVLGALTVMTYNVEYNNPDRAATIDAIAAADPDVVLLQEITLDWQRALVARFKDRYPHRVFRLHARGPGGMAVLSKRAIAAEEIIPSPVYAFAQRIEIDAPFGPVQILNVHLRPAIDRGSWIRGYFTTPPLRRREIELFWKHVRRGVPTIVAGDFNEEPRGGVLAFLAARGLARIAPTGPRTWHYVAAGRELLALDIDHVALDNTLAGSAARVLDAGTSDHRPVVVTIERRASP